MDVVCSMQYLVLLTFVTVIFSFSDAFKVDFNNIHKVRFNLPIEYGNAKVREFQRALKPEVDAPLKVPSDSGVHGTFGSDSEGDRNLRYQVADELYLNSKTRLYLNENRHKFRNIRHHTYAPEDDVGELQRFVGPLVDCVLCGLVVDETRRLFSDGHSQQEVVKFITKICIESKLQDEDVCSTMVQTFKVGESLHQLKL